MRAARPVCRLHPLETLVIKGNKKTAKIGPSKLPLCIFEPDFFLFGIISNEINRLGSVGRLAASHRTPMRHGTARHFPLSPATRAASSPRNPAPPRGVTFALIRSLPSAGQRRQQGAATGRTWCVPTRRTSASAAGVLAAVRRQGTCAAGDLRRLA